MPRSLASTDPFRLDLDAPPRNRRPQGDAPVGLGSGCVGAPHGAIADRPGFCLDGGGADA
jgi:hypothetical protein